MYIYIYTCLYIHLHCCVDDGGVVMMVVQAVFTFSMHGQKNFPLKKQKSNLDVELPDKCSDVLYLDLLKDNLSKAMELSRPDIVFYLAGVDVVEVCPLLSL